jgi:hypothetical protein
MDEYQYTWTDFTIDLVDNTGEFPKVTHGNSLNRNAVALRITFEDTVTFVAQSFKLMNECYATSCGESYNRTHDLLSIRIITLLEYSQNYPKDSDITELFKARESVVTKGPYISIDEIISKINGGSLRNGGHNFDLFLIDTTAIIGQQRFEVQLTMSDGAVLTQMTPTLSLF